MKRQPCRTKTEKNPFLNAERKYLLAVTLIVFSLFVLSSLPGWSVPCILHVFGVYCPFCGLTRSVTALLSLDFSRSFSCHALTLPSILYYLLAWCFPKTLVTRKKGIYILITYILYAIARNILLLAFHMDFLGDFIL